MLYCIWQLMELIRLLLLYNLGFITSNFDVMEGRNAEMKEVRLGIKVGSSTVTGVITDSNGKLEELPMLLTLGKPLLRAQEMLKAASAKLGVKKVVLGITGNGAAAVCKVIGIKPIDEVNTLVAGTRLLCPEADALIRMGHHSQLYLTYERDSSTGEQVLADHSLGNKCAAGSGAFLVDMSARLHFADLTEFTKIALESSNPAALSGRCGVFTESDIVHLYQKGVSRERIAAGIHQAIARNFISTFSSVRGGFAGKIIFVGGVSQNPAMLKYLDSQVKTKGDGEVLVTAYSQILDAVGAAIRAEVPVDLETVIYRLAKQFESPFEYESTSPLLWHDSEILPLPDQAEIPLEVAEAALGLDIGSVSTKAALVTEIDGRCYVLAEYYRKTDGDPLMAVRDTVSQIRQQVKDKGYKIGRIRAATTGSGRYLTADYVGADVIKNEITAQAAGTVAFVDGVDSILEIGGQDSKYIQLKGGVITDFEMNKACAAGTGAFLEKQAAGIGIRIEDYGDMALLGKKPPVLNSSCTIFTAIAATYFQQNLVSIEDLCAAICLASAKNYLAKDVQGRDPGQKIVFQGATARNKGMVAALATLFGRKIIVPPYPHLTGAIGAARLALKEAKGESSFRGFEAITIGEYEVSSFECKTCAHHCDVSVFQMKDGPKYYYNDRCERYSGVGKKHLGAHLPDLFAEREQMLWHVYDKPAPKGAKRVGVPNGLMFNEYWPLYKAFLTELGFEPVPSEPTTKSIIAKGLDATIGEPCFPIKVAHGHFADILDKSVDYIFYPAVLDTEPGLGFTQAKTCPYVGAAAEMIIQATGADKLGILIIVPRLHFRRGRRSVEREFVEAAKCLGKSKAEAKRAFQVGWETMARFTKLQEDRGREVLKDLGPNEKAIVVCGRPYTLYDPAINMNIGQKIRDLGILAIPQDFLPLHKVDVSDSWPNTYSRQIQKMLAAARFIREDPRLHAFVLTYYGCGPNTFANSFFKDEVGEACYVLQIDEHTADAGTITRVEAFYDTLGNIQPADEFESITTNDLPILQLGDRTLWIPNVSDASYVLAASFRVFGVNAMVLPRSEDTGLTLARAEITEDVCSPMLHTTEDILTRITEPGFDARKEVFFQGSAEGPCRFGMYHMLQRRILDKLGHQDVELVTLSNRSHEGGLGSHFAILTFAGLMTHDLLQRMQLRTRPYEVKAGETDAIYRKYVDRLCRELHLLKEKIKFVGPVPVKVDLEMLTDLLTKACNEFMAVEGRKEIRPLIGLVGEFFVRLHDGANQDVIRKIEAAGGEVWLAPLTEFFAYSNLIGGILGWDVFGDTLKLAHAMEAFGKMANAKQILKVEHQLFPATLPLLSGYEDIPAHKVIELGSDYIHPTFGGEAICSMGKAVDLCQNRGADGIVSTIPFNCMPGNTVTSVSHRFRENHGNVPWLNLDYDGFIDASRDAKTTAFMFQVKERFQRKTT